MRRPTLALLCLLSCFAAHAEESNGMVLRREKVLALNAHDLRDSPALRNAVDGQCYPRVGDYVGLVYQYDNVVILRLSSDDDAKKQVFCPDGTLFAVNVETFRQMVVGYCAARNSAVNPPQGTAACKPGPFLIAEPACPACPSPAPNQAP